MMKEKKKHTHTYEQSFLLDLNLASALWSTEKMVLVSMYPKHYFFGSCRLRPVVEYSRPVEVHGWFVLLLSPCWLSDKSGDELPGRTRYSIFKVYFWSLVIVSCSDKFLSSLYLIFLAGHLLWICKTL